MSTLPPNKSADFIASGILSAELWSGPPARPFLGLDATCARILEELSDITPTELDACLARNLELLREAAGSDCAFFATVRCGEALIENVHVARCAYSDVRPEGLRGQSLEAFPWLMGRLEHLRLVELPDTGLARPEQALEASQLAQLHIRSTLMVSLRVQGRPAGLLGLAQTEPRLQWDASLKLLLKLVAASITAGLERICLVSRIEKLEQRNELAEGAASGGLWEYDVESNETYFSPRWKAMLGYRETERPDKPDWRSLVHPDDLQRVEAAIRDHISGKTPIFESRHRLRHRNGEWRWVRSRARARVDEHGRLLRMVGIELDITEHEIYEEALFIEKERAQITLQSMGDGVISTDAGSVVKYLNPAAEELTGWPLEDALGRPVEEIFRAVHDETCEPLESLLGPCIRGNKRVKSVRPVLLIRRDGNELYIESTAAPLMDGQGKLAGGVLVFRDVSESRELNRRLSYHASHDALTGLLNRRVLEIRLERALQSAVAGEESHALCHLDIDQLKIVNDTCGHSAGDALLAQVGRLLKSKLRSRDTLARLGGDEFAILLESTPLDEAMRMANLLCESVRELRFTWEERVFRLGASIGVVPIGADSADVPQILSAADSACAAAKESGRNRVHSFQENDIELMRRRREKQWAASINVALEEGRFELFRMQIQPLLQHESGAHYELLVRLRDESGRLVSPNDFIAAAEHYALATAIDRWVIENAFRWLLEEQSERDNLALCSINLSGQSLGDDKFLPFVIEQLARSQLDGSKICFEITETAAVASFAQAKRFIHSLRQLGCKFALDDFGTGMSSFGYLKHFPVDFLKIDGSFVREILRDPIDREMVRSINEIGHLTGKLTIAEFAENAEIIQMLTTLRVDYAQGYGIAQPQRVLKSVA
jgi:diguanylate cyclase (GGDEF)-like protein/PAS domain S-box-containing protein